jgi:hypothetical protein
MFGNITNELFTQCLDLFKKQNNQDKLSKMVIDPVLKHISKKVAPYITILAISLIIIILCLLLIIYKLFKK